MPIREDNELNELLEVYLEELQVRRYSAASITLAKRVLPRFFLHLSEKSIEDIRAVEEKHVTAFAQKLDKAGLAPSSQNAYRNTLRGFFSFLERKRRLLKNPAAHLPFHRILKLPRNVLSVAEVERLMKEPDAETSLGKRNSAMLEIFYGTAIRLRECERLDLGDLDLKEQLLLIRSGKGKKDRIVPVPAQAAVALDSYLTEARPRLLRSSIETALFLSFTGKRLDIAMMGRLVKTYGKNIRRRVTPHGLRHACATHLVQRGADIRHVQELLGHQDIRTTAIYTRVTIEDLKEVMKRAHPRERLSKKTRTRK